MPLPAEPASAHAAAAAQRALPDAPVALGGPVARWPVVSAQGAEIAAIHRSVQEVVALGRTKLEHAARMSERGEALALGATTLQDCVGLFQLPRDPMAERRHARVLQLATHTAAGIGQAMEDAVASGRITRDALFSRQYTPIPGVEPPKFHTPFDALCDELLPPLQEPLLALHDWIVFAICANPNGYVPTHNLRFSQPLTGDAARDLVGNRSKRRFGDRVGRSVGAHTDPYRLQVYRRDTGQIMLTVGAGVRRRPALGRPAGGLFADLAASRRKWNTWRSARTSAWTRYATPRCSSSMRASPSAPASRRPSRPNSCGTRSRAAAPSCPATSTIPKASR
jgi:hypothetical protein